MTSHLMIFVKQASFFLGCLLWGLGTHNLLYSQTSDSAPATPRSYFEGTLSFAVELKGAQAAMIKENEPNDKLLMHLKDADYIVQLSGGRYPKTFIFVADSNYEYSMDMANKRAFRFSAHSDLNQDEALKRQEEAVAKATGKQLEVHGTTCEEYRMTKEDAQFLFYVNDKYRVNTGLFPSRPSAKASFLARGLEGRIPLKTVKRQKGLIVITTVNKISAREFDKEQFQIPPNFDVKNRDYRY